MTNVAQELENEIFIPVEDFYVFYEVPWDDSKFVKYPCPSLFRGNPTSPDLRDVFHFAESPEFPQEDESHPFYGAKYLGAARTRDNLYLRYILMGRTEIEEK